MKRIVSLIMAFSLLLTLIPVNSFAKDEVFTQEVQEKFDEKGYIDVLIQMEDEIYNTEQVLPTDSKDEVVRKRKAIIQNLKKNAEESQKEVLSYLRDGQSTKQVDLLESYYSTNTIRAIARIDVIEDLDRFNNIEQISLNDTQETRGSQAAGTAKEWNLNATDVNKTWEAFGTKGEGVTIGFIDSGAFIDHPDLKESFRGYNSETKEITTEGHWEDFVANRKMPVDDLGHGTAITGIAVGGDKNGTSVGVAPGSKWIAARAFSTEFSLNTNLIKAGEWMLAPDGDVSKAPDVINNSWGGKSTDEKWFNNLLDAWLAAGIFPVFAAGNEKGLAGKASIENPASLLDAFAVGAVDSNKIIGNFSKRGPSVFDPTATVIKPEVVAPGKFVYTTNKAGGYSNWTGTSIAAPHVAGVVALMKSVNKNLSNTQIRRILIETATPLTDADFNSTPNMAYGYGLVNAYKAVEKAKLSLETSIPIERIQGKDRIETSLKISNRFYETADVVYIANGFRFSDGLAMGPLTKTEGEGPLLLVDDRATPAAIAEIKRLKAKKIVIIGGEGAVSKEVEKGLELGTAITPLRLGGENRFDTNRIIAERIFDQKESEEIFLVNGMNGADALSISSQATKSGIPILLTDKSTLHNASSSFITENGIKKVVIIGGNAAVSSDIIKELEESGITVEVHQGTDRFETSAVVNRAYYPNARTVYLANGLRGADALTISPKAGSESSAIQLVKKGSVSESISSYLKTASPDRVYILGGNASIDDNNKYNIEKIFQ